MSRRILSNVCLSGSKLNIYRFVSMTHLKCNYKDGSDIRSMGIEMKQKFDDSLKKVDPFRRCAKIIKRDMNVVGHKIVRLMGFNPGTEPDVSDQFFPSHTDVLIIGGGATGSSIAYWLKQRAPHGMHVTVVETDPMYAEASSYFSAGCLRQQFSVPENVQMSLFGAEFLRNVGKHLAVDGFPVLDVQFQPFGCLVMASEEGATALRESSELQRRIGAKNVLLTPNKIKERFPWMDTTGVELGCLSLECEGWFDPWTLVNALKQKSINLGAEYVEGSLAGFEFKDQPLILAPSKDGKYEQLERAVVLLPNGEFKTIKFGFCIIAAGARSGEIAKMARIGEGEGLLRVPLPIEPRKRYVYLYRCPGGPGLDTPLVIDSSGAYFRREGLDSTYICGMSSAAEDDPPSDDLSVNYKFFAEKLRPLLVRRVPDFHKLTVKSALSGYYGYNTLDENGVIGPHPFYHNLVVATGFCGHGIQLAPAVGRAVMELLLDGEFKTIDLSRLSFDRLCLGEPLHVKNSFC